MDDFLLQSQDEIKVATEEILSNLYTRKNCTNKIIEAAKDDLKLMFLNHNYNIDEVIQTLQVKYPGDKVNLLIEKIESLKSDILYSVLINHNAKYGKCITDFDWSVKLVLGTSALKTFTISSSATNTKQY
ncbi:hypothetical protein JYU34_008913 [Plutella xylostella]|uniref:COMM domain-containing protein n=1 Tax=Plutella xylostella TaxID=51655 RepID=A0ABQ7QN33_PLUXY|nr:hypothetical protein JYU34_008913 [Plutella xylostella]